MAIPKNAPEWGAKLDPSDSDVYYADLYDVTGPLLNEGETVGAFEVSLQLESQTAGLVVEAGAGRAPSLYDLDRKIKVRLSVDEEKKNDPLFDNDGVALPVTFTVWTADAVPNKRQRSLLVRVVQQ